MGGIVESIGGALGMGGGGDDAGDAARDAASIQAQYQKEALDYLKETEKLPQEFREAALKRIAGAYGVPGGEGSQQELIDQAKGSALYQGIMSGQEMGEEAIMRRAAATGGLRSGNVQGAMYDYNTQLQNQALTQAYNQQMQGLGGLAQLPSLAPQIAQGTAGIGQTYAQGEIAKAQAEQAGSQQGIGNMMGIAQLGMQAFKMFSDSRLKKNIRKIGEKHGFNWYSWEWNQKARKIGLSGKAEGVLADEVRESRPDLIGESDGYMTVNYGGL